MRQVNAVQKHREGRRVQHRALQSFADDGHLEAPLLETFVRHYKTPIVPRQHFGAVPALRNEDEEVARVEALLPLVADDGAQPINAVSHVNTLCSEENPDGSGEEQHRLPERRQQLREVADVRAHREAQQRAREQLDLDALSPGPR